MVSLCIAGSAGFLIFSSDFRSFSQLGALVRVTYTAPGAPASVRDARGHLGVAQESLGVVSEQFRTGFVVYR